MTASKVTRRRIVAAIGTLGDLTTEDHEQLDGRTRDNIGHHIYVLQEILEARDKKRDSR